MRWRRAVFFILWILSLVGISFYGGAVSYGLFWGLTLIPVLSFLYLLIVFAQFRIYQEIESRTIVCKQPMPYFFALPNETYYSFASISVKLFSKLSYVTDIADGQEYELLPGDKYVYHTKLICKYRGEYEVGVKEVILTDFFRLFRWRYEIDGAIKALVYPRIIRKKELDSIKEVMNVSVQDNPLDRMEPDVVIRDYIPGDALKLIHWKASAREQKLKTRNLLGERKQEILLLYDTKRYSDDEYIFMPMENQILETVLALGVFFAEKNITFSVYYDQKGIRQCQVEGISQYELFYEETAHVSFDKNREMSALLGQLLQGGALHAAQTLILVGHEADDTLMKQLQMLAIEGISIVLYLVTDQNVEKYQSHNNRVKIVVLPVEGNLEEIL